VRHRIYVCAGVRTEALALDAAHSMDFGLSLFGGLSCGDGDSGSRWAYTGDLAVFAPLSGIALRLDGLTQPVHLTDVAFQAPKATAPNESSVAAIV
ncbi:hypothetical protein ABTM46_18985, partial [Acinetobacter baumannii]